MKIKFIEIQNFRKLQSVHIDFNDTSTLFVGANNSGKTSAMVALSHFLIHTNGFTTNDFTLSNWSTIDTIGKGWEKQDTEGSALTCALSEWEPALPTLDVWLDVGANEIHYVRHLVPTLDWAGGLLGVRLRFEPKKLEELLKEYVAAFKAAKHVKQVGNETGAEKKDFNISIWPQNLREFLDRKLRSAFEVKAYLLDPRKYVEPLNGAARPQALPLGSEPLEGEPFHGLIRIDEIAAQRGLGSQSSTRSSEDGTETLHGRDKKKLSEQLRAYYTKHLDPFEFPVAADLEALQAIENAQRAFDDRLSTSFAEALNELSTLNYPGVTDPKMKIATRLRPTDGLNHSAAVQYEVLAENGATVTAALRLPEEYNGLGYQNLISMVFKLMSFRDAWMRVGKADKALDKNKDIIPPLHLVLVEEPEAHLHAQVQQVFVRKAYHVLRGHKDLRGSKNLQTQLIVSTHSSHVAHESNFSCLRYFRRLPPSDEGKVPTSIVVNLSDVFGPNDETERFVTRYLKSTHCDLFFADAAILVEGPAERMLVPHFIRKHFEKLNRCYVTLLEIGGSHAHRFKSLIEKLGLMTLIITDIDSVSAEGRHPAVVPKRGANQLTGNDTLKTWIPLKSKLDELLDLPENEKVKEDGQIPLFSLRVAYQKPLSVKLDGSPDPAEVLATTFEDSLILENLSLFKKIEGSGMVKKARDAVETSTEVGQLGQALFDIIREGNKAEFALDLLWLEKHPDLPEELLVPQYIKEGLGWLESQLTKEQTAILSARTASKAEDVNARQ